MDWKSVWHKLILIMGFNVGSRELLQPTQNKQNKARDIDPFPHPAYIFKGCTGELVQGSWTYQVVPSRVLGW
jgi:hypothetical protein